MPLIVSFLIILLKTELPWMLLLQSLYENDELRSAEWLGRNPGGDLSSWAIGLCSEVLLQHTMKKWIQDLAIDLRAAKCFWMSPFLWLWAMFILKKNSSNNHLTHTEYLDNNHRRLLTVVTASFIWPLFCFCHSGWFRLDTLLYYSAPSRYYKMVIMCHELCKVLRNQIMRTNTLNTLPRYKLILHKTIIQIYSMVSVYFKQIFWGGPF